MTGPVTTSPSRDGGRKLSLVHVLVMFRHGDRSPITKGIGSKLSMNSDEQQFWISRLAGYELIHELSSGTRVVLTKQQRATSTNGSSTNGSIDVVVEHEDPPSPRHGGQWPCGQLTAKGVGEMTAKGRALRERYSELLDGADPQHDLYVHSTNIRRTIRSAQCILAGMFPDHFLPGNGAAHRHELKDQAIRIHVDESSSLGPSHSYELFQNLDQLLADDLRFRAPAGLRQTADRIRELTGLNKGRLIPWSSLREILVCRREHGLPLPDGFDKELFDRIYELDAWLWHTLYGKRDFCVGAFRMGVQRFHDRVSSILKRETRHKMTLFSAHDNSLVALMRALQLQIDRVIPHYGGMLSFEFYEDLVSGEMLVQASFEHEPVAFAGHEHATLCPVGHVLTLAQDFLNHKRPNAIR